MYASSRLYPYHDHPQRRPLFHGQVGAGPNQRAGGWYDRAVNYLTNNRNPLRDGEKHNILYTKDGFMPGSYIGPGTDIVGKLRDGIEPVSQVDKVAQAHDIRYSLYSGDPDKIRESDHKMLNKLDEIQKNKGDYKFNIYQGKLLRGKLIAEDLGLAGSNTFTDTTSRPDPKDVPILEAKLKQLEMQGYGQHGKGRSKTSGQYTSWKSHVAAYMKAHPGLSYKQALKGASKTYRKNAQQNK